MNPPTHQVPDVLQRDKPLALISGVTGLNKEGGKSKWCVNIQWTVFITDSPFKDHVLCNTVLRGRKTSKANQAFRASL